MYSGGLRTAWMEQVVESVLPPIDCRVLTLLEGSTPPRFRYEPKHWLFIHNLILRQVNSKHTGEDWLKPSTLGWLSVTIPWGIIELCMKLGLCGTCTLSTNRDTWIAIHYREDKLRLHCHQTSLWPDSNKCSPGRISVLTQAWECGEERTLF